MHLVENQTVILDETELDDVEFRNCKIIYRGGKPPKMGNGSFVNCEIAFEGSALNTVLFLRQMVADEGGKSLVLKQMLKLP